MEKAAKQRQDELEKEKALQLLKIKREHRPLAQLELHKHQAKIDQQLAEAQDRRKYTRMGGVDLKDIYMHEISRYDATVSRNRHQVSQSS